MFRSLSQLSAAALGAAVAGLCTLAPASAQTLMEKAKDNFQPIPSVLPAVKDNAITRTNVGGQDYYPFGVVEKPGGDVLPADDEGRFAVTKTADDAYVFRAAPLRNVALTAPYFHSGKVWDLRQAVAIMGTAQLGTELTAKEVDDITAFLRSLTGEMPRVEYPVLPPETDKTPRPTASVKP